MELDGVKYVFFGPDDMSVSLGYPGQPNHPEVISAIESMIKRAQAKGVYTGMVADSAEKMWKWFDIGIDFGISVGDLGLFYKIPENEPIKDDDKTNTKDEEQKSDITKDNLTKNNENTTNSEENNEKTTEDNTISIPNTGLEKEELVYKKEEYEKDFNNNSNNNPM